LRRNEFTDPVAQGFTIVLFREKFTIAGDVGLFCTKSIQINLFG